MTTETSNEDYLDLELTNFNGATERAKEMDSYLRLGAEDATVTHGQDLAGQIASFIDDDRVRGALDAGSSADHDGANTFRTLSQTERQTETAKLTTKGGWRDHTDGNRISTTRGDKVEVIRGNYKLLVLGREQWTGDNGVGLNYESSGGITYGFDDVPGQIVDVRWEFDAAETNTWRVIEECDKGHVVTRYHGIDKDWIQGGDFVTRVGSLKAYDGTTSADEDDFISDDHFDKPSDASHNASFSWPGDDVLPDVTEHVFAKEVYDKCIAKQVKDYLGSSRRWLDSYTDDQHATSLFEEHNFSTSYRAEMDGDFSFEFWLGAVYFEQFMGEKISFKSTVFFDIRLAGAVAEANLGVVFAELNGAGIHLDVEATKAKFDFVLSPIRINEIDLALARFDKDAMYKEVRCMAHYDGSGGINAL